VTDRPFLSPHSSGGMECRVGCINGNLILRELKYKEVGLEFGSPSTLWVRTSSRTSEKGMSFVCQKLVCAKARLRVWSRVPPHFWV
jgi:hypothetical protein